MISYILVLLKKSRLARVVALECVTILEIELIKKNLPKYTMGEKGRKM